MSSPAEVADNFFEDDDSIVGLKSELDNKFNKRINQNDLKAVVSKVSKQIFQEEEYYDEEYDSQEDKVNVLKQKPILVTQKYPEPKTFV